MLFMRACQFLLILITLGEDGFNFFQTRGPEGK